MPGPSAFRRLRIVRVRVGARTTYPALCAGVWGRALRVRSQGMPGGTSGFAGGAEVLHPRLVPAGRSEAGMLSDPGYPPRAWAENGGGPRVPEFWLAGRAFIPRHQRAFGLVLSRTDLQAFPS